MVKMNHVAFIWESPHIFIGFLDEKVGWIDCAPRVGACDYVSNNLSLRCECCLYLDIFGLSADTSLNDHDWCSLRWFVDYDKSNSITSLSQRDNICSHPCNAPLLLEAKRKYLHLNSQHMKKERIKEGAKRCFRKEKEEIKSNNKSML